jgi:hypothetical protein
MPLLNDDAPVLPSRWHGLADIIIIGYLRLPIKEISLTQLLGDHQATK